MWPKTFRTRNQNDSFQRSHLASIAQAKNDEERKDLHKRTDLIVDALGDGSDYTAFQDFARSHAQH
jgi:hypothetical protein